MTIQYLEIPEKNAVEITLTGVVSKEDYEAFFKKFDAFLKEREGVKILEIIEDIQALKGMDLKTFWEGLKFDSQHWSKYGKCAIVSDVTWFSPMVQVIDKLTSINARRFDSHEIDDARTWLYAPDDVA